MSSQETSKLHIDFLFMWGANSAGDSYIDDSGNDNLPSNETHELMRFNLATVKDKTLAKAFALEKLELLTLL